MDAIPNALVDRLASVDLEILTGDCVEIKVIPQNVKKSFQSLDSTLSLSRKIRYLLLHAYERLEGNPRLYARWLEVLAKFSIAVQQDSSELQSANTSFFLQEHVAALTEILSGCSSHWYDIGLSLRLQENTLKEIVSLMHSQPGNKFIFCLSRVINEWVSKYNEQWPPTVENLIKTLRSGIVGLGDVAARLPDSLKEHGICFQSKPVPSSDSEQLYGDALPLEIVRQSFDSKVAEEKSILLEVQAASAYNTTISYQWSKDGCPLKEDDDHFIGTRKQILCVGDAMIASKGIYKCEVSVITESDQTIVALSEPIVLTVDYVLTTKVLVEVYSSTLREIHRDSWPPPSNKAYVELALVKHVEVDEPTTIKGEVKKDREVHVEYESIFEEYRPGSLVLIEGRPGSGKTTLVNKITKDWASGRFILKGAKLVFLISLRGLSKSVDSSMLDILKFVYNTNDRECNALMAKLEASFGEGVCLILDGLDEYIRDEKYKSAIFDIIQRKYLQQSMVIVASRHAASSELRGTADTCIEVVGFLKEQILEYAENYPFTNKYASAEDLIAYLTEHPNILNMCYLPVHASMISFLYSKIRDDLPETESGIYKYFTLFTLLRKLKGKNQLESLDDLTGDSKEKFKLICKLAFDMTTRSQQVIEAKEFSISDPGGEESFLGLITIDVTAGVYRNENIYSFFHLTFQEFLAAYHVSSLERVEQIELITRYGTDQQMMVVWKFFCGLVNFEDQGFLFEHILKLHDDDLFHCQCAFESQQPSTCKSVVLFKDHYGLTAAQKTMNISDFTSVRYVISNAAGIFGRLTLHNCDISSGTNILACAGTLELCTSLQSLNLSANRFGDDGAKAFASCFEAYKKSLLELNLSENRISHAGATALADSLKHCMSLESLNLETNDIGDGGVQTISDALEQCGTLRRLNLAYNRIGDSGAVSISKILALCTSIHSFQVGGNDFSSAGVETIFRSLQNCKYLTSLSLDWIRLDDNGAEVLSDTLKACIKLQFLSLKSADIFDKGVIAISDGLKSCTHLQEINLNFCNINDVGAVSLATGLSYSSELQRVDLSWNHIGDEGAKALAESHWQCQCLLKLDLSENVISSSGIKYVSECFPLAVVYFYGNPIGVEGTRAVGESLKKQSHLELLDLSKCRMSSDGAVALAEGLNSCNALLSLDLQQNNIDDTGAEALAGVISFCSSLKTLDLSYNVISDSGASALAEGLRLISNFEVLHLGHNQICDKGARVLGMNLKACMKLRSLSLLGNQISKEGARDLAKSLEQCKFLKQLDLGESRVTGGSAKAFAKIITADTPTVRLHSKCSSDVKSLCQSFKYRSNMEKLFLGEVVGDNVIFLAENLKYCKKLKWLSLTLNLISDLGMDVFGRELKLCISLEKVYLQCDLISGVGARSLAEGMIHCENLQFLSLTHNQIGDDGAKGLAKVLQHCCKLKSLILSDNVIGDEGAKNLMAGLKRCERLEKLDLSNNLVGDAGAKHLAEGFKQCCSLRGLYLEHNQIGDDGARDLAEVLPCCKGLRNIHLQYNQIGDVGARGLSKTLEFCNLKVLELTHNQIGDSGAKDIAKGLQNCSDLFGLHLDMNEIGGEGVNELPDALRKCTKLMYLKLAQNNIGDIGAETLANGLDSCKNLDTLDLARNAIGDRGAKAIAEHIKHCTSIEELRLEGNEISDDSVDILVDGLRYCQNLCVLHLEDNCFSVEGAKNLVEGLYLCHSITI